MHSDFPPTTQQDQDEQRRIVSDMSGISEMDRGHLRGISETSVSTIGAPLSPASPASPFGPDSYGHIRERERSVGRGEPEVEDGILRQDGGRPSLVSPLSPPGGTGVVGENEDYMSARGSVGAGPGPGVSPTIGSATGPRRKSNFQESLD